MAPVRKKLTGVFFVLECRDYAKATGAQMALRNAQENRFFQLIRCVRVQLYFIVYNFISTLQLNKAVLRTAFIWSHYEDAI